MKRDTPLSEVARMLPTGVANELLKYDIEVQRTMCELIREAVSNWEENGVILEPVAYEVVVITYAAQALTAINKVLELDNEITVLRRLIHGTP